MQIKANLLRMPATLRGSLCQMEKVVELPGLEFDQFLMDPQQDHPFIAENCEQLHKWAGIEHCLLVLGKDRADGVLVQSEGKSRALFAAYVPEARTIVDAKLDQAVDYIARTGASDIDEEWCRKYSYELEEHLGLVVQPGNGLDTMLREKLAGRMEAAEEDLSQERKAALFDNAVASICDLYEGEDLYAMLHGSFGMTFQEIRKHQYMTDEELTIACALPAPHLEGQPQVRDILRMDGLSPRASLGHRDSIFSIPLDAFRELADRTPEAYAVVLEARVADIRVDDGAPELLLDGVSREEIDRLHDLLEAQKQTEPSAGPVM